MDTYWEAFIAEFRDSIPRKSLVEILEAFYYFCKDRNKMAKKLMNK